MSKVSDLHKKWSHNPEYRAAYEELGPEFDLARVLIEARIGAKLTQAQLAERMETTQSVIALSQASEDQDLFVLHLYLKGYILH